MATEIEKEWAQVRRYRAIVESRDWWMEEWKTAQKKIEELELECGKSALIIQDLREVVKYYQSLVIVLCK